MTRDKCGITRRDGGLLMQQSGVLGGDACRGGVVVVGAGPSRAASVECHMKE